MLIKLDLVVGHINVLFRSGELSLSYDNIHRVEVMELLVHTFHVAARFVLLDGV